MYTRMLAAIGQTWRAWRDMRAERQYQWEVYQARQWQQAARHAVPAEQERQIAQEAHQRAQHAAQIPLQPS